jgi:asparagine synthetase B (glutamine-hydrolysing)
VNSARGFDDPPAYVAKGDPEHPRTHVTELLDAGVAPVIDEEALAEYFWSWDRWGELFARIRPVPHEIPEPVSREWLRAPIEELALELRTRLLAAAEWATRGARNVGVLVGGVDSSSVLAAVARVFPRERIRVMSITGESGSGDTDPDIPYVRELCEHLGVRLVTDEWTPDADPVEDALIMDGRPSYAPFMTERRRWLEKLVDEGVDVVLAGTAGDLVFGGDFDEIGHRIWRAPRAVRTLTANLPWSTGVRARVRWLASPLIERIPHRARWPAYFGSRLKKRARRWRSPKTPAERIALLHTTPAVVTSHLYNHALMHGFDVTYRDVTLHSELVRFLACVPIEKLACDRRFRGLLHRAVEPWVTRRVARRRTKSFQDPLVRMRPESERILRDLARGTELSRRGFANGDALLDAFDRGDRNAIWRFLTVEAWLRRFA